jgi:osmotically-inducible protein OsmY
MGDRDRDRYQPYYDRNDRSEGRYGNRDESQYQRSSRDFDRDDSWQSQDRQRNQNFRDADERGYTGSSYAQDRDYGRRGYAGSQYPQERDFNAGYIGYESQRFPGTFGSNEDQRFGRAYEPPRFGRDYGASDWNRNDRDRPRFGREYGERSHGGSDWNRNLSQERYGQSNWGNEPYRGEQRGRDESWTQQLREAGQQVVRKVKRAFRGPKGYKRSDERIREDVNDRLAQQDHLDPSEIEVTVSNAEVTLIGLVESRHDKFLAEEIADDVSGVIDVHNQLRVRRTQAATTGQTSETSTTLGAQPANEASRNRNARAQ